METSLEESLEDLAPFSKEIKQKKINNQIVMKKIILPFLGILITSSLLAQKDTLVAMNQDTLKIGSFLIIKSQDHSSKKDWQTMIERGDFKNTQIKIERIKTRKKEVNTKWFTLDLGFANYVDATSYKWDPQFTKPAVGPALTAKSFQLNNGKSSNVNIWIVQQKYALNENWNLKYGLSVNMFNFRFEQPISYRNTGASYVYLDSKTFKKDKLYASYLTVPVLLNYSAPKKGFNIAGGISVGYLMNSRNKQIDTKKQKYNGNFNLNDFQVAGIGELGIGNIKLYTSVSLTNLYDSKLSKQFNYPFALGIRFGKF
jgi:hypothetical protein